MPAEVLTKIELKSQLRTPVINVDVGPQGPPGAAGADGANGSPGAKGDTGADGVVQVLVAGPGITIDNTDPAAPIVVGLSGGGGNWNVRSQQAAWHRFTGLNCIDVINNDWPTSYDPVMGGTIMTFAGTVKNLKAISSSGTSDGTDVFTVYKNGIATALAVLVTAGQQSGSNLIDVVSFVSGDVLSMYYDGGFNFNNYQTAVRVDAT